MNDKCLEIFDLLLRLVNSLEGNNHKAENVNNVADRKNDIPADLCHDMRQDKAGLVDRRVCLKVTCEDFIMVILH